MSIGIYKIENLINHHKYIGQSRRIEQRWKNEQTDAFNPNSHSYDYPLQRAIRKYGIENFSFEIIEDCQVNELDDKERKWIAFYDSYKEGYNQTLGGQASSGVRPKESIIGIMNDLKTTSMLHREIAEKWGVSVETVQGINTGRYWKQDNEDYPLQKHNDKSVWLKEPKKFYCETCGKEITRKAKHCTECSKILQRKATRPSREELKALIRTTSFLQIGRIFGVSDNAIRKWCDAYNLPRKVSEIKSYSDQEWENI